MKLILKSFTLFCCVLYSFTASAEYKELGFQDFESGVIPDSGNWAFKAYMGGSVSISKDKSLNHNGSAGSLRGVYPIPIGGGYVSGGFAPADRNLRELYIDFWAKMPNAKQGMKFCKIFGQRDSNGYANTTFGLEGAAASSLLAGSMTRVSFGDGSYSENDTANIIMLDGSYPAHIGRAYGKTAVVKTPAKKEWASTDWGTSWHHFRIHIKFNSGNSAATEVGDGEYYVEIDGKVYVDAKGLLNRHYLNKPIDWVSFFDWAQSGNTPFEVWFDDIRISTGGFFSQAPVPPISPTFVN